MNIKQIVMSIIDIIISPLDRAIKPINPKGNQTWTYIERTDAEAETQYFGHLMQRADSLEKTLMLGKIEGRRRKGWQRINWLDGITNSMDKYEQAPGDDEEQGSLACCSPWGHKESDTTEGLNNNKLNKYHGNIFISPLI